MSINSEMSEAINELSAANEYFAAARCRTADARRAETALLNRVNDAQKKLDALIANIKKGAPYESDWRRTTFRGVPADTGCAE